MKMYELIPTNSRKSFYGKAKVIIEDNGSETLYSYNTPVAKKVDGNVIRIVKEGVLTITTCTHIKSFCGLNKKEFLKLPLEA